MRGSLAEDTYDVIIVGAGPAGLTAAIYARRRLLKTLVLTMDIGGQVVLTENIENYLGYTEKSGPGLAIIFEQQARKYGTEITIGEVKSIEKEGSLFTVHSSAGDFISRSVIVTGGRMPRRLNVPGEEEFIGKGVSTSLTCNLDLTIGKNVAIVGGGNTALQRAEVLSKTAAKVYLIHRRDQFRCDEVTVEKVKSYPNVEFLLNTAVEEMKGRKKLEKIAARNLCTGESRELEVEMIFIDIGRDIKLDYVKGLVKTNELGRIVVDKACCTSCEGMFAAGDITDFPYAQAIIAAGQGATAILSAYAYLMKDKDQKVRY
jgi:thioredoxin reductase (NADPH)